MGMYDTIKYNFKEIPLPIPDDISSVPETYQTKNFDCALDLLEIREDGKLYRKDCEYEINEKINESKSFWGDKIPSIKEKNVKWNFLKITHTINIYDFICNENVDYDCFLSYNIIFIDGKVSSVNLSEFKKYDNQNRKKRDKEFKEYGEKFRKFSKTKRYKYIYRPYNKLIFKTSNKIRKFLNKLSMLTYSIESKITIKL